MDTKSSLKAAAAVVAAVLTISTSAGMKAYDDAVAIEDTSASETGTQPGEEIVPEEQIEWHKADVSAYDDSLSMISYARTTPDMFKLGDGLVNAQPDSDASKALSEEQQAMLLLIRKKIKNATPVLGKKKKSATPTAVEVYTSGGELKNVPAPQHGQVVESNPGEFAIQTYGWGHGVGLSQNGANFYAKYAGWTYQDILYHYYPGTQLMNTGTTDTEVLTVEHVPAGKTLDIIAGIVYHEMGSSMAPEAMKAQAVAAYTFLKYNNDDSFDMRMKADPPQNVIDCCKEVLGEALYYNDDFALTMFYASSGGTTSNCNEIFCQDLPYLRTVSGDYDEAYDPHYGTVTYMNAATMRNKIESRYGITLSDDPNNWIKPTYSPTSGYINSVNIDDQINVQGYSFSLSMGFKSCKFNITYTDYVKSDDDSEKKEGATIPILSPKDRNIAPPSEKKEVPTKEHPTTAHEEPTTVTAVTTAAPVTTHAITTTVTTTTAAATTAEKVTEPETTVIFEATEAATEEATE